MPNKKKPGKKKIIMGARSEHAAIRAGVAIALSAQGRFVIGRHHKVEGLPPGMKKITFAGVIIVDGDIEGIDGHWNMAECDLIIVPKKLHSGWGGYSDGMRLDQMLTGGYEDPEHWKEHTEIQK